MTSGHPILFSAPMVQALLAGRKTQTRRILKPPPFDLRSPPHQGESDADAMIRRDADCDWEPLRCPYGKSCDVLWVREAWQTGMSSDGPCISYKATPDFCHIDAWDGKDFGAGPSFNYDKCPGATWHTWIGDLLSGAEGSWRSPLHMPRWVSRLTLEITDVRVERLQDISEEDAVAEGATSKVKIHGWQRQYDGWSMDWPVKEPERGWGDVCLGSARHAFGAFINQLHGGKNWNCKAERPLWDQNPWVWALAFKVHQCNVDAFRQAAA